MYVMNPRLTRKNTTNIRSYGAAEGYMIHAAHSGTPVPVGEVLTRSAGSRVLLVKKKTVINVLIS